MVAGKIPSALVAVKVKVVHLLRGCRLVASVENNKLVVKVVCLLRGCRLLHFSR